MKRSEGWEGETDGNCGQEGEGERNREREGEGEREWEREQEREWHCYTHSRGRKLAERWNGYREQGEWDMEGWLERVYLQQEVSPAVSISSDDDTDSNDESEGEYVLEQYSDVVMRMQDDVDPPGGVDSDGDVDMERVGDNQEKND